MNKIEKPSSWVVYRMMMRVKGKVTGMGAVPSSWGRKPPQLLSGRSCP